MSFYETYDRDYTGVKEQNRKSRKECEGSKSCQGQKEQKEHQKQQEQENTYRF